MDKLKIIPHNDDIEKALLGAMIIRKETIQYIIDLIKAEDFYNGIHKVIFNAIAQLETQGKIVDLLTLLDATKDSNETVTPTLLAELMDVPPATSSTNVMQYIRILKEYKHRRDTIKVASCLLDKAYEGDYLQEIQSLGNVIADIPVQSKGVIKRAGELLETTLTVLENNQINGGCMNVIKTGFTDLDQKMMGITKGEMTIIAARPSMGKTAFMLNMAENIGVKQCKPTAIFSMEMSTEQVMQRLISQLTFIDSMRLKTGQLNEEDWIKIGKVTSIVYRSPLYIDDTTPQTVSNIRNKCKEIKGIEVIFIDYLDFLSHEVKIENRVQQIGEITKALKIVAKQLNIAVVLLVQLNRLCEQRTNKRPVLSDLRDSGAIEQDADMVLFLYRDGYYNPESDKQNTGEVIISKNRNGQTGTVELEWLGKYTKYVNKSTCKDVK